MAREGTYGTCSHSCGLSSPLAHAVCRLHPAGTVQHTDATQVDVNTKDNALKKEVDKLMIQSTPTLKILRQGVLPTTWDGEKDEASLLALVDQLTYKNSVILLSKVAVQDYLSTAATKPPDHIRIRAYVLFNLLSKDEEKSFTEVAAYAMQQGAVGVKYAVCPKRFLKECNLQPGEAKLWRYDLPEDLKESGLKFQGKLTDTRAFHIFTRGGIVPPIAHLTHVHEISFYNSATIPVVYLIGKKAQLENAFPAKDALRQLGWEYMGRVALAIVEPKFIVENVKHFNTSLTIEDAPVGRLCKFASSATCYNFENYDASFRSAIFTFVWSSFDVVWNVVLDVVLLVVGEVVGVAMVQSANKPTSNWFGVLPCRLC